MCIIAYIPPQINIDDETIENMFDNNPETSWYSSQGKFQYICVFFDQSVSIYEILITFSGGFSPKEIEIGYSDEDEFENKKPNLVKYETINLEDSADQQKLILKNPIPKCKTIRLLMKKFYDLYGRIIIYDLKVKGNNI